MFPTNIGVGYTAGDRKVNKGQMLAFNLAIAKAHQKSINVMDNNLLLLGFCPFLPTTHINPKVISSIDRCLMSHSWLRLSAAIPSITNS
jgi:hypothetical protein